MTDEGLSLGRVLAEAQAEGYAEADPTFDIEGIDSAHKLQILATLAFRTRVGLGDIYVRITRVTPEDIALAHEMGFRIKLLAIAKSADGRLELRVHPTMIPEFADVGGFRVFNAVFLNGDVVDDLMFYGRGRAVPSPHPRSGPTSWRSPAGWRPATPSPGLPVLGRNPLGLKPIEEVVSSYYLNVSALDRPGVLAQVAGILGKHNISIANVIQKVHQKAQTVPVVMMTHEAREGDMQKALREIDALPVIVAPTRMIRVEES